jgi:hypothetical protein
VRVVQRFQRRERGVEPQSVVQRHDLRFRNRQRGSGAIIECITVGDNRIQPVVAACELQHHEDTVVGQFFTLAQFLGVGVRDLCQPWRRGKPDGDQRQARTQKLPPRHLRCPELTCGALA